jgi:hypothetical protein
MRLDHRPVDRRQRYDRKFAIHHVLLIQQGQIARHKNVERFFSAAASSSPFFNPDQLRYAAVNVS